MNRYEYVGGVLRKFWNATTRIYTEYDAQGVQTLQRPFTAAENTATDADAAADTAATNKDALLAKCAAAIAGNITFLGIASPTTAQMSTQLKAVTRQLNALLKIAANDLQSQNGT